MTGMTDFTPSELSQIYFSLEIYKCNCVSLKSSSKEKKKIFIIFFLHTFLGLYSFNLQNVIREALSNKVKCGVVRLKTEQGNQDY